MRQTELHLIEEDRSVIEEIRSKGLHHARQVNRAHLLSWLDRGVRSLGDTMFRNLRVDVLVSSNPH
jgi:hypothetical protein